MLDFTVGDRSEVSCEQLYNTISFYRVKKFFTDYWKAYSLVLPYNQHQQSKAETYTIEGLNSRIRHYLARFKRKTKCYSKSIQMVIYTLKLFFFKIINKCLLI